MATPIRTRKSRSVSRRGALANNPDTARVARLSRCGPSSVFNLREVLELLRQVQGVDLTHYKRSVLLRRIGRRMALHELEQVEDYARLLRERPEEVESLCRDILVSATRFFRDPEVYERLKSEVFPELFESGARADPLRLWVLGCATGEEAYSLTIALSEYMAAAACRPSVRIFATDLNAASIEQARTGVYSKNIVEDVAPKRMERFFMGTDDGYRVHKAIRDLCIFAQHDALTEPPFSRIDLVSCRNVLIYLGQKTQRRLLSVAHYALKPDGFLWLGSFETMGSCRDLFEPEAARHRIYRKKPNAARHGMQTLGPEHGFHAPHMAGFLLQDTLASSTLAVQQESDRILLSRFAPASVTVNGDFDILQFRGNTGRYLAPASGRPSLNLLKMLRDGLLSPVRAALREAKDGVAPVRKQGLRVEADAGWEDVDIEVIPMRGSGEEDCYLVLFEPGRMPAGRAFPGKKRSAVLGRGRAGQDATRLEQELTTTREYLQAVIEQQEATNEELQSANEEVQSANEELQSINEELEASREEMQANNETLAVANEELNRSNAELSLVNTELSDLLASAQLAILVVGMDLRIRRFTPAAGRALHLMATDVGRSIKDLKLSTSIPDFERQLQDVIRTARTRACEIADKIYGRQSLELRPYRTADNKIDGAVIITVYVDDSPRDAGGP